MPDTVILLEHPPVVTLGRRTDEGAELHVPAGTDVEGLWNTVVAAVECAAARIQRFDPSALPVQFAGEVRDFDPTPYFGPKEARTRIFFATDVHGSEQCFRKWLNAARVYDAQVLVLGGDITGQIIVPLVGNGDVHRLHQLGTTYSLVDAIPDADAICAA